MKQQLENKFAQKSSIFSVQASFKRSLLSSLSSLGYRHILLGILMGLTIYCFCTGCSMGDLTQDRYIIGQDPRWKDLHLNGKERNFSAFSHDLLKSIAKLEDFQVVLNDTFNPLRELQEGKIQGILTNLKPNYSNKNLLFSDPYFLVGPVLIISTKSNFKYPQTEEKKIIGIPTNSRLLRKLEEDPFVQIKFYDEILNALADLRDGQIDGAMFPVNPAYTYTETFYKQELKITTAPLTDDGIRLVALKNEGGKNLIEKFNQGLKTLKDEGSFRKMLQNWGFIDVEQVNP